MGGVEISAVVCTYNRADVLGRCLDGFARQSLSGGRFEVLVVDNNSADGTWELVRERLGRHSWLRLETEPKQGLSHARNRGIEAAKSDLIAFVDDDAVPQPDYLEEILKGFAERPEALCIGGRIELETEIPLPEWINGRFESHLGHYDMGDLPLCLTDRDGPYGSNIVFRREAFRIAGNFDPRLGRRKDLLLSNEENALLARLKQRPDAVFYRPGAVVRHIVPAARLTREWIFRRIFYHGVSTALMEGEAAGRGLSAELRRAAGRGLNIARLLLRGDPYLAAAAAWHLAGEQYGRIKMRSE